MEATDALTTTESVLFAACESDIAKGLEHFVSVGTALMQIKDKRLYRMSDASFSAYCNRKWRISNGYAYRLIAACEVAQEVSPIGSAKPTSEAQCRPLTRLDTPEEKNDAWREAVETAPTDDEGEPVVTAAHVAEVVERRKPSKPQAAPVAEPEPAAKTETDRIQSILEIRDEIRDSFAPGPRRYDAIAALNHSVDMIRILEGR